MTKAELRKSIRQAKARQDAVQLQAWSHALCRYILGDGMWRSAGVVLLYHALPDEVDTRLLIDAGRRMGKTVLLPVCVGDELELRVFDGVTRMGAYGIQEPVGEVFTGFDRIDLAIVPGMAFDALGNRLGRGKGYYDRLLPRLKAYRMGLCFPFQLVEQVPVEDNDVRMNEVVSRI